MHHKLLIIGERMRGSFWMIPALMIAGAMGLAQLMLYLDKVTTLSTLPGLGWMGLQDPDSARSLLTTIAASTITVAGTVFSITVVALTLASNQFGPRLVRNFMRDRGTQAALGIFLATFIYALMVLRGINAITDEGRNHDLAVHTAVVLSVISIGFLIYFIHNVALSIQVDNVTFHINREFSAAIDEHYPSERKFDKRVQCYPPEKLRLGDNFLSVFTRESGYLLAMDKSALVNWAEKHDCCIRMDWHPGSFINHWSRVARIYEPPRRLDSDEISAAINDSMSLGALPTAEQDVVFSVHQLAQIAVRALSPGINDPFTAYSCIDRLVDGLGKVLQRPELPNCFHDEKGVLRLVTTVLHFADLLDAAFDEIREYGRESGVVMLHLLNALSDLANVCTRENDIRAFNAYLDRLGEDMAISVEDKFDRTAAEEKITSIRYRLSQH
ncbi:DUF2254 domain-containing protein [Microbulbifer flavimaris]|uniref:DUF2254 domain-containing protein n=1 Tax=Microbulbifer flavimaris TaxID=1781068 RepID=A0ABX4I1J7_9GAMM|nr:MULTISPECIES: DUF2254 domain-containing protein [Microbulbifer]KUJ84215.1 hypothetical protein AVO43_00435 [Microbulbifer sp. ZGT114]PCO06290.1 DUF2254 domain-containing protein [Microbulbifer flavimaris]